MGTSSSKRWSLAAALVLGAFTLQATGALACGGMMVEQLNDPTSQDGAFLYYTKPALTKGRGALTRRDLEVSFSRLSKKLGICYDDFLRRQPGTVLELSLAIDVSKLGLVSGVALKSHDKKKTVGDADFAACLKAAALDHTVEVQGAGLKNAFTAAVEMEFVPPYDPASDEDDLQEIIEELNAPKGKS
jgi:hypothetical protein